MIKVGKKLYLVLDSLGGEVFITRDAARSFRKEIGPSCVTVEALITPTQQKAIQILLRNPTI